ncbi:hypothetical protein DPMN_001265 [Dreissena polymorpha]|uniref:Uncharacterized protein n=1 Tax=Dreissena polymorpha TaxID=45954 RepID=A0A9D4MHF7_DREPO|nr:hypothetical protein DPMN_001265 [Dreissena polymorpha]
MELVHRQYHTWHGTGPPPVSHVAWNWSTASITRSIACLQECDVVNMLADITNRRSFLARLFSEKTRGIVIASSLFAVCCNKTLTLALKSKCFHLQL